MVHRDFLPPSALDGYDEMMRTGTETAPGPYEQPRDRRGPITIQDRPPRRPSGKGAAPPTLPSAAAKTEQVRSSEFCYAWNRWGSCEAVCTAGRLHACEFCFEASHRGSECTTPAAMQAAQAHKARSGGKKGAKGKGAKGKGAKGAGKTVK